MAYSEQGDTRPMSVGDWFITLLILAIPLVNIIMYLVWALSSTGNVNRKNFCIASLIWCAIGFVLAAGLMVLLGLIGMLASVA